LWIQQLWLERTGGLVEIRVIIYSDGALRKTRTTKVPAEKDVLEQLCTVILMQIPSLSYD
jgi:hypothetical protein